MYAGFVTFSIVIELSRFETLTSLQQQLVRFVRELRALGALILVHLMWCLILLQWLMCVCVFVFMRHPVIYSNLCLGSSKAKSSVQ